MLLLVGALVFSYWPGLLNAKASWNNAQYSHGWLVPLFAVCILFWWRKPIGEVSWSARLAGMLILVASVATRLVMARYRIITIDMYTFVPALMGVILLGGGWGTFRWAAGPAAFLIFMYPLPDEATRYLLGPLQTLATTVSTFAIQTLGVDAVREGNRIIVGERHLGVVDACSGLRMLTIFMAFSVAIMMVGDHDWIDSLLIVLSSVPIALLVNAVRITATGIMYTVDADLADKLFHDWAGYFMMPMALGLLFLEQKTLGVIRTDVDQERRPTPLAAPVATSTAVPAAASAGLPGRLKDHLARLVAAWRASARPRKDVVPLAPVPTGRRSDGQREVSRPGAGDTGPLAVVSGDPVVLSLPARNRSTPPPIVSPASFAVPPRG